MYSVDTTSNNGFFIRCFVNSKEMPVDGLDYLRKIVMVISRVDDIDYSIDFTCNTNIELYNFSDLAKQLRDISNKRGPIKIFTSGRNVKSLIKLFPKSLSNVSVYVDDYEVRTHLNSFVPSDIKFTCYLSEKYLLNISDEEFNEICGNYNLKFDRNDIINKRATIKYVWESIISDIDNIECFSKQEKVMLVMDYIRQNVDCIDVDRRVARNIDGKKVNFIVQAGSSEPLDALMKKCGNTKGISKLACLLLDNYLARVDCHEVRGRHLPTANDISWIVTKIDDKKYGHCLATGKRFKDLSSYGYSDGMISLEEEHVDRKEFVSKVEDYSQLSALECDYLDHSLKDKLSFLGKNGGEDSNSGRFVYQKVSK